jgi:sulfide dehydrogenase cytochrome subunit
MNVKLSLGYSGLAVCLLASPLALGAGASGEAIGFTCAGCHGTDGESQGSAPSLKGEDAATLKEMLMDFKTGKEEATVMDRIAKGYSDEELAAVAEYFAKLK